MFTVLTMQIFGIIALSLNLYLNYFLSNKYKHELIAYHLSTLHAIFPTTYRFIGFTYLDNVDDYSSIIKKIVRMVKSKND